VSTPTTPSKRYFCCAANQGANWGTATAVNANDGIMALDDGGFVLVQSYDPYPAVDQIMAKSGDLGLIGPCDFSPPVWLQYEPGAWGGWLAALFGTEGTGNSNNAITHTFTWANSVEKFFTVVQERPGKIWECASAMPYKLVISPDGSHIKAVATLRGNTIIDTSVVNTDAEVANVSYVSTANFVNFTHGAFLMASGNGALTGANDTVVISDFEISLERAVDAVHVVGSTVIASPIEGGIPTGQLKVTLPRASGTNLGYLANFVAAAPMHATLTFTGGVIANATDANNTAQVTFGFPRLIFKNPPDAKLEDVIKTSLTFDIEEAGAAPTGMASARPYCIVRNGQTSNYTT
jgi:hypothetical protein